MMSTRQFAHGSKLAWILVALAAAGCNQPPYPHDSYGNLNDLTAVPECDATVTIAGDSNALLVTDPESLAELQLDTVLQSLIESSFSEPTTPAAMLAGLFDQTNDTAGAVFDGELHCDSYENPAHANGPAAFCPRSEGALAMSKGFFTKGDPDHFFPVAAVNRFDLTPVGASTCGEYRIVYAKESGLTDPNNRVFLIFETSLPNPMPGNLLGCRPVAEFWRDLGAEADSEVRASMLRSFFFEGLPGFGVPLDPLNVGMGFGGASYYGGAGQIRVSQHMDVEWETRELGLTMKSDQTLGFLPRTVGSNPRPQLFDAGVAGDVDSEKDYFQWDFAASALPTLAARKLEHIGLVVGSQYNSGESAFGGESVNDYASRVTPSSPMYAYIEDSLAQNQLGEDCPADDPLTPDAILRRATMMSCAGCHAPAQFLGPERKIGCGLTWPDSLGNVHIDETGKRSPALEQVFLPHRAEVLTTYLQACDEEAILANVGGPFGTGAQTKSSNGRQTLGGSTTH